MSSPHTQLHYDAAYQSPVGWLGIRLQGLQLQQIDWLKTNPVITGKNTVPELQLFLNAFNGYFTRAQDFPELPLAPQGTAFQIRVWSALRNIPCGKVVTYGQLAKQLNTGCRAIGQACRSNPIPVLIPCHRVVAASGIGGYMGGKKDTVIKQWLLAHEGHG